MDLRGFQAAQRRLPPRTGRAGTRRHLRRVVVLHDGRTDRAAADSDIAAAPAGRFVWVDAGRLNQGKVAQILSQLLD